ncbi:MAG: hypothetical protein ACRDTC_22675 [Pseudonocardiaceae bacterium]
MKVITGLSAILLCLICAPALVKSTSTQPFRNGITITATDFGPVQLTLPEVDRFRGVLRDARLILGLDPGTEPISLGQRVAPRRIVVRERPGGQG